MGNANVAQLPRESLQDKKIEQLHIHVIGESYVGKTCLVQTYNSGEFQDVVKACLVRTYESGEFQENTALRVGALRYERRLKVQNIETALVIYNVSGQERFREKIVPFFVCRAEGVLLLYDVASVRSFHQLPIFLEIMEKHNPGAIIFIIGARSDLEDRREVSRETGQQFAYERNFEFIECSSKTGENVNEVFELMALRLLQKKGLIPPDEKGTSKDEIEGKCLERVEEKLDKSSVKKEESVFYGCASKYEPCNNSQKLFENNGSENLKQRLKALKTKSLAANGQNPGHQQLNPGHEDSNPGHKDSNLGHKYSKPGHEDSNPGHEKLDSGHENLSHTLTINVDASSKRLLETLETTSPSAADLKLGHKGSNPEHEIFHMLTINDSHASSKADANKSSELNDISLTLENKKDVPSKTEKPVLSEEEMFLQGKCPAWEA